MIYRKNKENDCEHKPFELCYSAEKKQISINRLTSVSKRNRNVSAITLPGNGHLGSKTRHMLDIDWSIRARGCHDSKTRHGSGRLDHCGLTGGIRCSTAAYGLGF